MGMSKARAAQKKRRRREKKLKLAEQIVSDTEQIISDAESDQSILEIEPAPKVSDTASTESIPQSNHDSVEIRWVLLSDTDDETRLDQLTPMIDLDAADTSDEEAIDDEAFIAFFPVFTRPCPSKPRIAKRKRKKNKLPLLHYKRPVSHINPNNKKLMPCPIPRSTAHDWKKVREKAIGKNNNMMARFLGQPIQGPSTTPIPASNLSNAVQSPDHDSTVQSSDHNSTAQQVDHSSDSDEPDESSSESDSSESDESSSESDEANPNETNLHVDRDAWIERCVREYRDKPSAVATSADNTINQMWTDLDLAINQTTDEERRRCKLDPTRVFPATQLDELREFNNQRRALALSRTTKTPALLASKLTAQSSLHCLASTKLQFSSGTNRARKIRAQAAHLLTHRELITPQTGYKTPHVSMLDDRRVFEALYSWAAAKRPGEISSRGFLEHTVKVVLPQFGYNGKSISPKTAISWMRKIGLSGREYQKSLYYDGHERADVIEARKKFLIDVAVHRKDCQRYDEETLLVPLPLDPHTRQKVMIYHDESTIHANERPTRTWLLNNTTELRTKNVGRLIHTSDFILETTETGRLEITDEIRARLNIPASVPSDACVVICPGANGDAWWTMPALADQIATKAIPIFNALHPNAQGVWVFDCSSAHQGFGPTALRVQNMNLSPGGKQAMMRDTVIPSDDPNIPSHLRGLVQSMVFPADHPDPKLAGKPKGGRQVLVERGLWDFYSRSRRSLVWRCATCSKSGKAQDDDVRSARLRQDAQANGFFQDDPVPSPDQPEPALSSDCCASRILSLQSDFANEKPLIQKMIEEAGHICLFLPKFHCELNPIELFWSYIKSYYRRHSIEMAGTFAAARKLWETARKSCPVVTIRKYFRKIDRQHSAYTQDMSGPQCQNLVNKVYRSHRQIPRNAAMRIDMLNN